MNLIYLVVISGSGTLKVTRELPKGVTVDEKNRTWRYKKKELPLGRSRNYRTSEGTPVLLGVYDSDNLDHLNSMVHEVRCFTTDMLDPASVCRN